MQRILKTLVVATIMNALIFVLLAAPFVGRAAPAFLPNCAHNSVSRTATVDSGPPDLARSQDAGQTYTAIVWAEGDGLGQINLAYSNVISTSRLWLVQTIDSGSQNSEPSLVFDPVISTTVHLAYQTGTGVGNSRIKYAKCTLGGSCSVSPVFVHGNKANVQRSVPQIALNTAGNPVIVYQEIQSAATPDKWMNYAYITGGGSGTISDFNGADKVGATGDPEKDPTIATAGNTLHVAYAVDNGDNAGTDAIKYLNLGISSSEFDGTALPTSGVTAFGFDSGVNDPEFPAIGAIGNSVSLVWDVQNSSDPDKFYLAYNKSGDGGANWVYSGLIKYKYIPSNNTSNTGPDTDLDERLSPSGGGFTSHLRPDLTMHLNSSITITHVAWQEATNNRRDVMYSFYNSNQDKWQGTPILTNVMPISFTNVTTVYGESEANVEGLDNLDNARPKILFGHPGNRLQVVYMHEVTNNVWDVYYNGWQLGDGTESDPTYHNKDSDCDTASDAVEIPNTPSCPEGAPLFGYAYNCNDNQDGVPDFMDHDSDGDGADDYKELLHDPGGTSWRDPTVLAGGGGVFLPIILKAS